MDNGNMPSPCYGREVMTIKLTSGQAAVLKSTIYRDLTPALDTPRDRDLMKILDQVNEGDYRIEDE